MVVVDVPIELDHVLFVGLRAVAAWAASLIAVNIARDVFDARVVLLAQPRALDTIAGTGVAHCKEAGYFGLFIGCVNKQLVLDKRAANAETHALFGVVLRSKVLRVAVDLNGIAAPLIASRFKKGCARPLVSARLSHRVDVTRREAAVSDVKRREFS